MFKKRIMAFAACAAAWAFSTAALAGKYEIDPVHSSVIFRVRHMDISNLYGRINSPTGTIQIDEQDPTKSTFSATMNIDAIDTNNAMRDTHLKSDAFFDAKQFPTITFKSTSVKAHGDDYEVAGSLTMHGVTKEVTLAFTKTGQGKTPNMGERIGFETTLDLKKSDYGIKGVPGVGDDIHIIISVEAELKP